MGRFLRKTAEKRPSKHSGPGCGHYLRQLSGLKHDGETDVMDSCKGDLDKAVAEFEKTERI